MRINVVTPDAEHELEVEEGESAELLRWQLLSVGVEPHRALLVAEGYGAISDAAVLGTPPLTDGTSIALLSGDGQPFARTEDAAPAAGEGDRPNLAHVLEQAPQQLEAAMVELTYQSADMVAGLREMSDAVNAGITCESTGRGCGALLTPQSPRHRATWRYDEPHVRAAALKAIPLATLLRRGRERHPDLPRDESTLRALLRWFKRDFFKWVNSPKCEGCGGATMCIGGARPTPAEVRTAAAAAAAASNAPAAADARFVAAPGAAAGPGRGDRGVPVRRVQCADAFPAL